MRVQMHPGSPIAIVAIALTAIGCGGPSVQDFAPRANAICAQHSATIEAAASELLAGGQLPEPEEFGRLAQETIIPELTAHFAELREVEPPADVADAYGQYLSLGEQKVADLREDPSIITDATNFEDVNRQADAAGLSAACHVGPS